MTLRAERVTNDSDVAAWQHVAERCVPVDHPGQVVEPIEEVRSRALRPDPSERHIHVNAFDDDELVGCALLSMSMRDNLSRAHLAAMVLPERRGHGLGTELVASMLDIVRGEGRDTVSAHVSESEPSGEAGRAIARRLGATPALETLRSGLDLSAVTDPWLDELLAAHVGARADGYGVVTWIDHVPDELLDGAAHLMGRMSTDTPRGSLDIEAESWDGQRYRDAEDVVVGLGRMRVAAGVVDAAGNLVASSDYAVVRSRPRIVEQWDTIVDPAHRGRRLGLVVKVANLRHLKSVSPESVSVQTYNAVDNTHMLAVNKLLGFVPLERYMNWQLKLS